jgi:putative ABC transport system substrate-binding protein
MSYWQSGYDAALMAARVMRGESPGKIPFARPGRISLIVSPGNAEKLGMTLPDSLIQRADQRLDATGKHLHACLSAERLQRPRVRW